jgi:hypothetical protein
MTLIELNEADSVENKCRRFSRFLWRENPSWSIDDVLKSYDIKCGCDFKFFQRDTLVHWILPRLDLRDEFEFFEVLGSWTVVEAVSIWVDINPFVMIEGLKAVTPDFFEKNYHTDARAFYRWSQTVALRAAISQDLKTLKEVDGEFYVDPHTFYDWAIHNLGEPKRERTREFFEKLLVKVNSNISGKQLDAAELASVEVNLELNMQTSLQSEVNVDQLQTTCHEIYSLFDPVTQTAVATLFDKVTKDSWCAFFNRAARNGLKAARQGDSMPAKYNPSKVADWLVNEGLYTREHADRKLANTLPYRSRDSRRLLTGELE